MIEFDIAGTEAARPMAAIYHPCIYWPDDPMCGSYGGGDL